MLPITVQFRLAVSGGMLGTGMSIVQVQGGHLGHLLGSHKMDGTVPVLCRPVNPYTVSSPNYTPPQLHDTHNKLIDCNHFAVFALLQGCKYQVLLI